jgi:hypothetical protein
VQAAFAQPAPAAALTAVMNSLQSADAEPTALQVKTIEAALTHANAAMARWNALRTTDLLAVNTQLTAAGIAPIGRKP